MENLKEESILRAFEESPEYKTFIEIEDIKIFCENDQTWLTAEDMYFDIEESENHRTFDVYFNGGNEYYFEEY